MSKILLVLMIVYFASVYSSPVRIHAIEKLSFEMLLLHFLITPKMTLVDRGAVSGDEGRSGSLA